MKRIIWTIGILLAITLFGITLSFEDIINFQDLKEAGYTSVVPTKLWGVKNEKGTYYTNDYRIQFVFEVDGHKKYIDMNAMKAYETDDFIKVKSLYKNKKPIEGYVYYSESGNIAYLSKTETNKTDFVFKQTKVVFIIMIVSVILFVLPLWIPYVIDILSTYKKEKGLSEN